MCVAKGAVCDEKSRFAKWPRCLIFLPVPASWAVGWDSHLAAHDAGTIPRSCAPCWSARRSERPGAGCVEKKMSMTVSFMLAQEEAEWCEMTEVFDLVRCTWVLNKLDRRLTFYRCGYRAERHSLGCRVGRDECASIFAVGDGRKWWEAERAICLNLFLVFLCWADRWQLGCLWVRLRQSETRRVVWRERDVYSYEFFASNGRRWRHVRYLKGSILFIVCALFASGWQVSCMKVWVWMDLCVLLWVVCQGKGT